MSFEKRQKQAIEKLLQSNFGLWNSLLTVNGILLSAFSAIYAFSTSESRLFIRLLIGSCLISLLLIVYNHIATKVTYHRIGEVLVDECAELSDEQRRKDINRALFRNKAVKVSEWLCLVFLLVEVGLVAIFVYEAA